MKVISDGNFYWNEFTRSQTATRLGIENEPNGEQSAAITELVRRVMQPIRLIASAPVTITSGFRCPELNEKIGGTQNSQHCKGEAADFVIESMDLKEVFKMVLRSNVLFDQIIYEFDKWIHISYSEGHNRNKSMIAKKVDGKTVYELYEGQL